MEQGYTIEISPITKTKTIVFTQMEIKVRMNFGQNSCIVHVVVFDEPKENYKMFEYVMDGTAYLEWTTDNYLINWVKNKIRCEVF